MPESREALAGSSRNAVAGARLIGKTNGTSTITVTVVLKRKTEILRDELHQHSLLPPHDRPIVDHAAFARQYGASDDAVAAVTAFAAAHHLTVTNVDRLRRVIELTGSVADMEAAFGTQLHDYAIGPHAYRGRRGPLLLPSNILPHVEAVLGLDNRPVAKPRVKPHTGQGGLYPQQIAALYNFPQGDGTGQTIALIELGGNYGQQDLQTYFASSGLNRVPTVRTVSVSPGVPVPYGQEPDNDQEVMLDIEVAGAMAPGATIVVYFADNTDQGFYQAVSQAVHDAATTAVSISWGSPEKSWSTQTMDSWDSLGQSATLLNVPIFVAAGDHGCTDEQDTDPDYDGQRNADFPGTCASGTASCGGTILRGNGSIIGTEVVWNDNDGWATGGGISTYFKTPTWQNGLSAEGQSALLMRGVPDVAGTATGIIVRVNNSSTVSGGTSAVAPQWAALTAVLSQLLKRKAGFFIPLLYANAKAATTNDIVSGNNSVYGVTGFSSKQGWDACTGLGSPNGQKLLALLSGVPATVGPPVTVAPTTGPNGDASGQTQSAFAADGFAPAPFDAETAAKLGEFVLAAYSMYAADPNNLMPEPNSDFPSNEYQLAAWVHMRDFIVFATGPTFYGFIAQSKSNPSQFVMAIRGTQTPEEWWDDLTSIAKTPCRVPNCGFVAAGFNRIYETMEIVERPTGAAGAAARPQSLRPAGSFAQQAASLVKRLSGAAAARTAGVPATASIAVVGHSLGSALATLYTLENARGDQIHNPVICTLASPRVGDASFVAAFSAVQLTSWRVVNAPDVVPMLPPEIAGFKHVGIEQTYDSSKTAKANVLCWHSLATYLSLLDRSRQPDPDCRIGAAAGQPAIVARDVGVGTDGNSIGNLIAIASDPAQLQNAQAIAAKRLLTYDGEQYPSDGCAITLSVLLQSAGVNVPDTYQAIVLGEVLKRRGWQQIPVGSQAAGDVGSTCGTTPHHGTDHIYLVLRAVNSDEMVIADNQDSEPHFRFASGQGKSPTRFFLRASKANA